MFVVNALYGINAGTWALILTTIVAIVAMLYMFHRPPVFPLIASTVTIVFGALTLITHDPMWVQIKVTIFNALFAGFLFLGLWLDRNFFQYVFEKTFHYTKEGWDQFTRNFALVLPVHGRAERGGPPRVQGRPASIRSSDTRMSGVDVWIAFKLFIVLPMSGIYAWLLTKWMSRHHL